MAPASRRTRPARPALAGAGTGGVRVAVVTRISTDELNQPYSLEAQAAGLDAFVASQPGHTITHRFVDQASGATLARPGLQAALAAAKTGQFDVLLVYRIDRLTRSIVGLMSIVEELDAAGVALRSATEPIDTQGPVGRMLLQLLGIFAEFERGLLIDRITKGFERKAARGEWLGGPGPYGYQLDSASKTLTVEAGEAAVVRAIYARYTDERSGAPGLAHWLNDTGRRSRRGRLWSTQTVLRVLRNPVYVGKIVHGEDLHEGKHEPILDEATFARAQLLLQAGSAESPAVRPNSSDYLLSGLLRCTACHGAYVGAGAHGRGGFYRYYVCRTGQAKGAHACAGPRIPAQDLEDAITTALVDTYTDSGFFEQAATDAYAHIQAELPRLSVELAASNTQLRDTTAAIDRYLRAFEAGTMSDNLCAPRIAELSARRDELTARARQLSQQAQAAAPALPDVEHRSSIASHVQHALRHEDPHAVKQLLQELVDRIDISPDKRAQPYFWVPQPQKPEPPPARATTGTTVRMRSQDVEVRGLEPLASSVRGRRSTRLSYTPWSASNYHGTWHQKCSMRAPDAGAGATQTAFATASSSVVASTRRLAGAGCVPFSTASAAAMSTTSGVPGSEKSIIDGTAAAGFVAPSATCCACAAARWRRIRSYTG